ncbi:MAG TPA: hypothetical protein VD886_12505 [Herpetosiphonaceae bacterium]|nr:hypothetical protein [Herpetosiphonaceae bacterium]
MGTRLIRGAALALLLAGCGQATRRPDAGALPIVPTLAPAVTSVAPSPIAASPAPATPTSGSSAPATTVPAGGAAPAATGALTPTFATYREPRGTFTVSVPDNWQTTPLAAGIGITSVAYNATAIATISLTWQAGEISPTAMAQIAEEYKNRLLESYLTKNLDLSGAQAGRRYTLKGTATLTGTPTTIEISLEQTAGGTLVLQSWLVPTELWADFQRVFQQPIQASLAIDDAAVRLIVGQ